MRPRLNDAAQAHPGSAGILIGQCLSHERTRRQGRRRFQGKTHGGCRALAGYCLLVSVVLAVVACSTAAQPTSSPAETQGQPVVLLEPQGKVEVLRQESADWVRATNSLSLRPGDMVRTGGDSRAMIRVTSQSTVRLGELTLFQLRAPREESRGPLLRLGKGVLHFFHRDRPASVDFETPLVSGAIRGTEFTLRAAQGGESQVSVLEGEVEISGPQGVLRLSTNEQGLCEPNGTLHKSALLEGISALQWCLYYPAVLDPDELSFDADTLQAVGESLAKYRAGDLPRAVQAYPAGRQPAGDSERVFRAALLLAVGEVERAQEMLATVPASSAQARALEQLIAAVTGGQSISFDPAQSFRASVEMADSYYHQSQFDLFGALVHARSAAQTAPQFGFAWARVAELEFSFGQSAAAEAALEKALQLSPHNAQALAVRGFVLAAQERIGAAIESFDQAIRADSALGNAWLGRGLCRIRRWQTAEGRADLLVAAALEPNRALLRSYLGKAFADAGETARAARELALAQKLDPRDPTAWLYSALLNQQRSRINEAISDLEHSQTLNENRRTYRSRLLLDEDQAVRGANLANLYRDAGMVEVSQREAARAVSADYANFSAHVFLADSYNQLRDPAQVNLRFETPWLSEFLLANLLAPVSAGTLSQTVSEQEYGKLFERNRLGLASSTEYLSRGDWTQAGVQYGVFDHFGYAIDTLYRSQHGERPNQDQDQMTLSLQTKVELTSQDSIYLQAIGYHANAGDLTQYYDPAMAHTQRRITETQQPILLTGYHHEWSPGSHTLFLAGWLQDSVQFDDPINSILPLLRGSTPEETFVPGAFLDPAVPAPVSSLGYHSDYDAGTVELQQIWQGDRHALILGARGQFGEIRTTSAVGQTPPPGALLTNLLSGSSLNFLTDLVGQNLHSSFNRESFYLYDQWRIVQPLALIGGVSYDRLEYPLNYRIPPISSENNTRDQVSPKAGLVWNVGPRTALRAAYTRSLGGVSLDQSFRLEPSQIAGFVQALRSVGSESVIGEVSGAHFETWGVALDQTFPTRTYFGAQADWLSSRADRVIGVVDIFDTIPTGFAPSGTPQELASREKSLLLTANQLVGNNWSVGATYRLSRAELRQHWPELSPATGGASDSAQAATLHQVTLLGLFNHPSGLFARGEAIWLHQDNSGYSPALPGDDFWQLNVFAGYRFLERRVELTFGLLNLTDRDYHLNPLNLHTEYPHRRTLFAGLKLSF